LESWGDQAGAKSLKWIDVNGRMVHLGDQVRLRPKRRADAIDMFLAGRTATIEAIEQDYENRVYLAVTVTDDPGMDFGLLRQPGHRFFYTPDEIEPLKSEDGTGR
jgi:hypothetical protein